MTAPTTKAPRPVPGPPRPVPGPTLENGVKLVVAPVKKLPLATVVVLVDCERPNKLNDSMVGGCTVTVCASEIGSAPLLY